MELAHSFYHMKEKLPYEEGEGGNGERGEILLFFLLWLDPCSPTIYIFSHPLSHTPSLTSFSPSTIAPSPFSRSFSPSHFSPPLPLFSSLFLYPITCCLTSFLLRQGNILYLFVFFFFPSLLLASVGGPVVYSH